MASAETSPSETPEWLKPSPGQSASTGAATDEESLGADGSPTAAPVDSSLEGGTDEAAPAPRRRCTSAVLGILELVLLAAFVYAAIVQSDDPDKLRWHLYYAFQAALPALFLAYFFCCRVRLLGKTIAALAVATGVWSIVYIVLVSLDLQRLLEEEEPDAEWPLPPPEALPPSMAARAAATTRVPAWAAEVAAAPKSAGGRLAAAYMKAAGVRIVQ